MHERVAVSWSHGLIMSFMVAATVTSTRADAVTVLQPTDRQQLQILKMFVNALVKKF